MQNNTLEIVNAYYAALDAEGITTAAQLMADDFKFFIDQPQPLDKRTFVAMMSLLSARELLGEWMPGIGCPESSEVGFFNHEPATWAHGGGHTR